MTDFANEARKFSKKCGKFRIGDLIKYNNDSLDSEGSYIGRICFIKGPYDDFYDDPLYRIYIYNKNIPYLDDIDVYLTHKSKIRSTYHPVILDKYNGDSNKFIPNLIDNLINDELNELESKIKYDTHIDYIDFKIRINQIESLCSLYLEYLKTITNDELDLNITMIEFAHRIHIKASNKIEYLCKNDSDDDEYSNLDDMFLKRLYQNLLVLTKIKELELFEE